LVALLFPGQGSQKVGMGAMLFEQFANLTEQADQILGYSMQELCLQDSLNQLGQTQFTQPALFIVGALSYLKYREETTQPPMYVAGHSVGEYAALFAAGVFDFDVGLQLVKKRGELMARVRNGGMAAVVGLTEEQIRQVLSIHQLSTLDIANYNAPTQFVLAGPYEDLLTAQAFFETAGAKVYTILNVSGAFHSRYMFSIQDEFRQYVQGFHFSEPCISVISTVHARPYTVADLPQKLVEQLTSPVLWTSSVQYLLHQGEQTFVELGIGSVLTKLVRRILKEDNHSELVSER
jgi:trans-AT polyketide synthase, acyltransferase and oxidoreductase domains